jgi:hypothetical protein
MLTQKAYTASSCYSFPPTDRILASVTVTAPVLLSGRRAVITNHSLSNYQAHRHIKILGRWLGLAAAYCGTGHNSVLDTSLPCRYSRTDLTTNNYSMTNTVTLLYDAHHHTCPLPCLQRTKLLIALASRRDAVASSVFSCLSVDVLCRHASVYGIWVYMDWENS